MAARAGKLLLLGIDAADLGCIRARGVALPNLRRILGSGRLFEFESPKALTGSVWPTFSNGTEPGVHGIYQHFVWDPARMGMRVIGPNWRSQRPFWADLERRGFRTVVFDVPYSYQNNLRQGVEITDYATHSMTWPRRCNRKEVGAILDKQGRSPIGREAPIRKSRAQLDATRRRLMRSAEWKARAVTTLMREAEWDVFIAIFSELHRGGHLLFGGDEDAPGGGSGALLDVYRAVDAAVGRVLDRVDPTTTDVVIFAAHGMTRNNSQSHIMRPLMQRLNDTFLDRRGHRPPPVCRPPLVKLLRRTVPARLQLAAAEVAPDKVRNWVVERETVGGLDWSRTPGFALRADFRAELRLNLAGREAAGILEPGSHDHRDYVDFVYEVMTGLVDAESGARLVDEVVDIPGLHAGPNSDLLPDLAVTWRGEPAARHVRSPHLGRFDVAPESARGGDHTDLGFAVLAGDAQFANDLPRLWRTSDFAAFATHLATHLAGRFDGS